MEQDQEKPVIGDAGPEAVIPFNPPTLKVKVRASVSGEGVNYGGGEVVDMPETQARSWVEHGMAELVEDSARPAVPETPEDQPDPETPEGDAPENPEQGDDPETPEKPPASRRSRAARKTVQEG